MSTGWVWDTRFAFHDTGYGALFVPAGAPPVQPGLPFAENPLTKTRFRDLVEATPALIGALTPLAARRITDAELGRLHAPDYVERLRALAEAGGGDAAEEGGAPLTPGSYEIARLAAGGALVAVEAVMHGEVDNAYALVRPPGHHAEAARARGFCFFGNTALAALHARAELGAERVAIVDWDVHHGNGTEDAFYDDPDVLTISLHADRLFPVDRGLTEHRGAGRGRGTNINVPLPDGTGSEAYISSIQHVVVPAIRRFAPDLVLVACGLDASAHDPLGRQLVHSNGFRQMTELLLEVSAEVCDGRLVCIHEGGYSEGYVPFCGVAIVEALLGIAPVVDDPFLVYLEPRPAQRMFPHQEAAIAAAEALVADVPVHTVAL
jgi:acetoin utilization deacetylase AcuC-like enzyme